MTRVELFDSRTNALALVDTSDPRWEATLARVGELLSELGCEYVVEAPFEFAGSGRTWVGVYSTGTTTCARWREYVERRCREHREALEAVAELQGLLRHLGNEQIEEQIRSASDRLSNWASPRLEPLIQSIEQGSALTQADWVLDVPEGAERDLVGLLAAVGVRRTGAD